jgi:glutamyl-tRNA synthetase
LNQQHIIAMAPDKLGELLTPYLEAAGLDISNGPDPAQVAAGFQERAETLVQLAESCRYCYEDFTEFDAKAAKKNLRPVVLEPMKDILARFEKLADWNEEAVSKAIEDCAAAHEINMGKLGQPVRVAVTGGPVSPPIDVTLVLVGREKSLARIGKAVQFIEERAAAA